MIACSTCTGTCRIKTPQGRVDACPSCAAIAEAEWQLAKHSKPKKRRRPALRVVQEKAA